MTIVLKILTLLCILSNAAYADSQCTRMFGSRGPFEPRTAFEARDVIFSGTVKDKVGSGRTPITSDIFIEIGVSPTRYSPYSKLQVRILEDNGIFFAEDFYHSSSTVKDGQIQRIYTNDYLKLTVDETIQTGHKKYVLSGGNVYKFTDSDNLAPRFERETIAPFSGFAKQSIGSTTSLRLEVQKKGFDDFFIDITLEGRAMELLLENTFIGENGGLVRVYETPRSYSNDEGLRLIIREPSPEKSEEATAYEIRMHNGGNPYFATSK